MLLYLHGFRSSPRSKKAVMTGEAFAARGRADEFVCPQLPASPREAAALIESLVRGVDPARLVVVGSSLGGYYATWFAERTGCRAAVLNPAIRPYDTLKDYLGPQPVYGSEEMVEILPEFMDELLALDTPRISRPERYLLLAATGDQLLDWREMVAKYAGAKQVVIQGSDHELNDFADHLPQVLAFCGVS